MTEIHTNPRIFQPGDSRLEGRRVISIAELLEQRDQNPLTGLANRLWVMENLPAILTQNQGNVGILSMDLDGLKAINDTHGHNAGDKYLQVAAIKLRDTTKDNPPHPDRQGDIVVHLSGDEFLVILPGVSTDEDMQVVMNKYDESLLQAGIKASIGGAVHLPNEPAAELIDRADKAMYKIKNEKRFAGLSLGQRIALHVMERITRLSKIDARSMPGILDAMKSARDHKRRQKTA